MTKSLTQTKLVRYKFLPYSQSSKITCPSCGRKRSFSRYYDTQTGKTLDKQFGRCDREQSCSYHYSPYEFPPDENNLTEEIVEPKEEKDYYNTLNYDILTKSRENKYQDNFSKWLIKTFGERAKESLDNYLVGCHGKYCNTVFWYKDINNQIRSGKVMQYNIKTGKRNKESYTTWVHSLLKIKDYQFQYCLFGEFLLNKFPDKKIGFVESEKTAIILSLVYPQLLWIAGGQLYCLQEYRLSPLQNKEIVFYADKGLIIRRNITCTEMWEMKLKEISKELKLNYKVSNFLETQEDMSDGSDLADWIISQQKKISNKNLVN